MRPWLSVLGCVLGLGLSSAWAQTSVSWLGSEDTSGPLVVCQPPGEFALSLGSVVWWTGGRDGERLEVVLSSGDRVWVSESVVQPSCRGVVAARTFPLSFPLSHESPIRFSWSVNAPPDRQDVPDFSTSDFWAQGVPNWRAMIALFSSFPDETVCDIQPFLFVTQDLPDFARRVETVRSCLRQEIVFDAFAFRALARALGGDVNFDDPADWRVSTGDDLCDVACQQSVRATHDRLDRRNRSRARVQSAMMDFEVERDRWSSGSRQEGVRP